jgi:shikimate kinase
MVEESGDATIEEIFNERGETEFRKLEAEAVERAAGQDRSVIACGGGAVLNADNVEALRRAGTIVYLRVSPEIAGRRIASERANARPLLLQGDRSLLARRTRAGRKLLLPPNPPPLTEGDIEARLRQIIDERSGVYETAADDEVDADVELNQIVEQILRIAGDSR